MTNKNLSLTVINILSTIVGRQYQEVLLINKLNNVFIFDHNIFLLHSSADIHRFFYTTTSLDWTPRSLFIFENFNNFSQLNFSAKLQGKNKLLVVATKSSITKSNLDLLRFVKKVQLVNVNIKIGIFFQFRANTYDVHDLFEWCWHHRILNIFIAFYSSDRVPQGDNIEPLLNVFNFNPFGEFKVVNLTGSQSLKEIFHGRRINFEQYPLRLAVIDDESITQYSSTVPFIDGPDEKMWKSVFEVLNASYSIFWVRNVLEPLDILDNGTIDIHADLTELTEQSIVTLYPMIIEILLIVVPKASPYPTFTAYLHTMFSDGLFCYVLVVIIIVVLLLTICRYLRCKKLLFFQSVADVLNLLMNDNGAINYPQLTHSEVSLIIPLTFAGFVLFNGFLSNLKSHFTQPIIQPQIDTLEDYYKSGLSISTPNDFWRKKVIQLLNSLSKYDDWDDRMRENNSSEVIRQIVTDSKFSFFEYESTAKGICKYKKYHITKIQLQWIWFSYNVRYDFPFTEHVNEVIQWVRCAGLYNKWWMDLDEEKLWKYGGQESQAESFSMPIFIVYGWIASAAVFIVEIIWKKFKLSTVVAKMCKGKFHV